MTNIFYSSRIKVNSISVEWNEEDQRKMKLYDSELKVMDILWEKGETAAKDIAAILKKEVGWSKSTTYTVLKKCIEKKAIERVEPNFICRPLISKEEVQLYETNELIEKMYDGAADQLIANLLNRQELTPDEIKRLKELVKNLE